jgi:agmatine/peptidylarginine deiminase
MRDSGPIVIKTEATGALNFNFNGWAKYKTSNWTNIFLRQCFLDIPLTQVMYKGKAVIVKAVQLTAMEEVH